MAASECKFTNHHQPIRVGVLRANSMECWGTALFCQQGRAFSDALRKVAWCGALRAKRSVLYVGILCLVPISSAAQTLLPPFTGADLTSHEVRSETFLNGWVLEPPPILEIADEEGFLSICTVASTGVSLAPYGHAAAVTDDTYSVPLTVGQSGPYRITIPVDIVGFKIAAEEAFLAATSTEASGSLSTVIKDAAGGPVSNVWAEYVWNDEYDLLDILETNAVAAIDGATVAYPTGGLVKFGTKVRKVYESLQEVRDFIGIPILAQKTITLDNVRLQAGQAYSIDLNMRNYCWSGAYLLSFAVSHATARVDVESVDVQCLAEGLCGDYSISVSAGSNGTVAPNGNVVLPAGGSVTLNATPSNGYTIDRWFLDGAQVSSGVSSYTLSGVDAYIPHVRLRARTELSFGVLRFRRRIWRRVPRVIGGRCAGRR